MPVPVDISREHVLEAMTRLQQTGIPRNASSTKFDVVDPREHSRFPPKLVLSVAAEIATGTPLSRREFSGGEETNSRLRELGFEVVAKDGAGLPPLTINELKSGMVITNDQLTEAFSVGNAGGMRWSSHSGCLVIIADHTKGLYDDRWDGDTLYYTGMGKRGHQTLTGQNLRLAQQAETQDPVHLFEVFSKNEYTYVGRVELVADTRTALQPDADGKERQVYVYPLRLIMGANQPKPRTEELQRIASVRRRALKKKSIADLLQLAQAGGQEAPAKRDAITTQYVRNEAVATLVKRLANGRCDLCQMKAPFETAEGPFLECHHVIHLADGGSDEIQNTVALCPNCHRRMHALRRLDDVKKLRARIQSRTSEVKGLYRSHSGKAGKI
jgi:5-methylcytosine-specific restriction protein A